MSEVEISKNDDIDHFSISSGDHFIAIGFYAKDF